MPQTSPAAILESAGPTQAGLPDRSRTPPVRGALFAIMLAILARVLVGPIPIDTGMPVQQRTRVRRSRHHWGIKEGKNAIQVGDNEPDPRVQLTRRPLDL